MNERNYYLLEDGVGNLSQGLSDYSSLQNIVELSVHRIKMLREIEQEEEKSVLEERDVDYGKIRMQNKFVPSDSPKDTIAREVISHLLCKMAFAFYTTPDQWEKFARSESIILYDKIKNQINKIEEYFSASDLKIQPLTKRMYDDAILKIKSIFSHLNLQKSELESQKSDYFIQDGIPTDIKPENLIMFRFYDHPNLLKSSQIVLHKGYIIIRKRDKKQVIQNIFQERLLKEMKVLNQKYQNNGSRIDDERLAFLKKLPFAEVCDDTTSYSSTAIHVGEIDLLAKRDMPACMTYLMEGLKEKSHLRHQGRLQLGLFLKGAGLGLQEALSFWQNKFSRTVNADEFKKRYEYNIKHNYGKLGKQTDYTPMSCSKITQTTPLNGEYHGCPFKTLDNSKLKAFLKIHYKITDEDYSQIENYKKTKNYAIACREVFRLRNEPKNSDQRKQKDEFELAFQRIGNHPNAYFEQSFRLHEPHRFKELDEKRAKASKNNNYNNNSSARKDNQMDLEF